MCWFAYLEQQDKERKREREKERKREREKERKRKTGDTGIFFVSRMDQR